MENIDIKTVLRKIDSCLAAQGKKKYEFYKETGISSASYSQWNKGVCLPSHLSLAKAANYLGMSYEELVFEEKKEAPSEDETSEKDPVIDEIIELLLQLSPEQLQKELYYLRRIAGDPDTE